MNKNKLYILILTACLAGYSWIAVSFRMNVETNNCGIGLCTFKYITNMPCPSCGSTRSVLSIMDGDIIKAMFWNPIGLIIFIILIVFPIWIIADFIKGKSSLYRFYNRFEILLKQKTFAVPTILLVLVNWVWNIYKGL